MLLETQMVEQYTMNTKQGLIKLKGGTTTAITANISSGDFDITQQRANATGQSNRCCNI